MSRIVSTNLSDVFVSNYTNPEFILQHLHERSMIIESVTIISAKISKCGGYPVGSGLIFTGNHPSFFGNTSDFDSMTLNSYKIWLKNRQNAAEGGLELEPWEPVGFFNFNDNTEVLTVEIDYKRPAKYLFIKPISLRPSFQSHAKNCPYELQFVGAKGN